MQLMDCFFLKIAVEVWIDPVRIPSPWNQINIIQKMTVFHSKPISSPLPQVRSLGIIIDSCHIGLHIHPHNIKHLCPSLAAARIITRTPSLNHIPVKFRIEHKILLHTFKAIQNLASFNLSDLLHITTHPTHSDPLSPTTSEYWTQNPPLYKSLLFNYIFLLSTLSLYSAFLSLLSSDYN